jgi:hypothetical protein
MTVASLFPASVIHDSIGNLYGTPHLVSNLLLSAFAGSTYICLRERCRSAIMERENKFCCEAAAFAKRIDPVKP